MNNPPTFSSFPARIAPTIEQKGERDSKAHRHAVADRNALPHKDAKRRRQRTLDNSERHSPPAPLAEPIRPSRDAAYKDVGFDRTRFSSAFSVDPPTYRRRAHAVVGLSPLFRIEHGKEVRGMEVGSRDIQANSSRTRLPLEPPPAKIRRFASSVDFDQHASFVAFSTPSTDVIDGSDLFEHHFSDLPRSDAQRQSRVTATEQQLLKEPRNIEAWLKYSTLHIPSGDLDGPFDQASAEVSLAILDRAIALNISADLHLAYLCIARHVQTPSQLAVRWQLILDTFTLPSEEGISVHMAYLGWCETDGFGTFGDIEEILAIYSRTIGQLRFQSSESTLLYLFLRAARFLKNTGHDETSLALFQALIEITFFKPPELIASTASTTWWDYLLAEFQPFWDSESPRFGEPGSMGWRSGKRPSAPAKVVDVKSDDWYTQEISKLPDPFSTVIFEDIQPFLVPITSPSGRLAVIHALLNFLGVSIIPPDNDLPPDPFLYSECVVTWPEVEQSYPWIDEPPRTPLHDLSMRYWAFDIDTLFSNPSDWFSFAKAPPYDLDLARQCMTQLQPFIPDPRFSMMLLAIDSTSKRAKTLLSQDRNNLNMWYAYAALEIGRRRYDSARSVFAHALSFAKSRRPNPDADELDLLAGWVQLESDLGETSRAIDLLMQAAGYNEADFMLRVAPDFKPPKPTATQLLRAKALTGRLAFFYNTLVQNDRSYEDTSEPHLQFICRQLWLDRSKQATKELVATLATAIDQYPSNTMFQTLRLILTESRSLRAAERVIESTSDASVIHQIWGIGEMARLAGSSLWKADGSGAERLRELFQRIIRSSQGRQSLAVWKIYIEFESKMGSARVKQLCYRAVAIMGSCKELYLLPFSPALRSHFTPQELRDWLLLMVDRGIRVRVPFEHLLEVNESHQLPSDEEPEEDELAFLQEAERLKPYE